MSEKQVNNTASKIGAERDNKEGKKNPSAYNMPVISNAQPAAIMNESLFTFCKLQAQN